MANAYSLNYPTTAVNNHFSIMWKLTRTMKAAGWTYEASSNGTTKDTSGTAASDLWGGNVNPLVDAYPSLDAVNAWWVGRGPSTVKIPITAAPTGAPVRGEKITQATSAAEGELVGYVFDATAVAGWLVVLPHTGTFDNTHTITGSISGATFTPNGTVITYVREVMIGKVSSSVIQGSMYYVCADVSGESASLFTTLAASAGCTTSVWPGGGGSGNSFPTIAMAIVGTGGTTSSNWYWFTPSATVPTTMAQMAAVNTTPGAGVSADGSFFVAYASSQSAKNVNTIMFSRLDDAEPGDIDPYIWLTSGFVAVGSWSRTAQTGQNYPMTDTVINNANIYFVGNQARGVSTGSRDVVNGFLSSVSFSNVKYILTDLPYNSAYRMINHPAAIPPIMLEPVFIFSLGNISGASRQYKGRMRWFVGTSYGNTFDTLDQRKWLVVSPPNQGGGFNPNIALAMGPLDGTTIIST